MHFAFVEDWVLWEADSEWGRVQEIYQGQLWVIVEGKRKEGSSIGQRETLICDSVTGEA